MSHEIERESESTRPERENPALPVPAFSRAHAACPPHVCDLTDPLFGGRPGRRPRASETRKKIIKLKRSKLCALLHHT